MIRAAIICYNSICTFEYVTLAACNEARNTTSLTSQFILFYIPNNFILNKSNKSVDVDGSRSKELVGLILSFMKSLACTMQLSPVIHYKVRQFC